jgi:hypothetical protein
MAQTTAVTNPEMAQQRGQLRPILWRPDHPKMTRKKE